MNKNELSKILGREIGTSAQDAVRIIDVFTDIVKKSVTAQNPVSLRGFGTFSVRERKPKRVNDIARGKSYVAVLPPKVSFSPSDEWMKDIAAKFTETN